MKELIKDFFSKNFGYEEDSLAQEFLDLIKYIPEDIYEAGRKEGYEDGYRDGVESQKIQ